MFILLTCAIDAREHCDMISLDMPNAFIQAELKQKKGKERVVMKVRGRIVDWLVELDPAQYEKKCLSSDNVFVEVFFEESISPYVINQSSI